MTASTCCWIFAGLRLTSPVWKLRGPGNVWQGNLRADTLATAGVSDHRDDTTDCAIFEQRHCLVNQIQKYLFRTQCRLGALKLTVWQRGLRKNGGSHGLHTLEL